MRIEPLHPCVFLIGLHGCGKTTVGDLLQMERGWRHISIGSLARLARKRRLPAEFSHQFMVRLSAYVPGLPLSPRMIESLTAEVQRHQSLAPVSVDGFPASPDHVALLPEGSRLFFFDIDEDTRQERLTKRAQETMRKWTPGLLSQRDLDVPFVVEAAKLRAQSGQIEYFRINVAGYTPHELAQKVVAQIL